MSIKNIYLHNRIDNDWTVSNQIGNFAIEKNQYYIWLKDQHLSLVVSTFNASFYDIIAEYSDNTFKIYSNHNLKVTAKDLFLIKIRASKCYDIKNYVSI